MHYLYVLFTLLALFYTQGKAFEVFVNPKSLGIICSMRKARYVNASIIVTEGMLMGVYAIPKSELLTSALLVGQFASFPETILRNNEIGYDPFNSCIGTAKSPVKSCSIGSIWPNVIAYPNELICLLLDNRLQAFKTKVEWSFMWSNVSAEYMMIMAASTGHTLPIYWLQVLSGLLLGTLLFIAL
ncbi:hypothetical protein BDF19DRAFT_438132 [Syncephalis fuscata]|nr:hypothetical protein BDF19DRAFT_438132 [Syncephalis fuscata]